ncbi:PREDICTED: uncharacterized protein LOC109172453 isoform X2 [Ipomoea nil]|nr:PREDICTED: uncharacterized protein LOC109172453 isoform X2 [Ipomoea nil]XP_019177155.1 PREDICTED: uncharacterized protein LOC109172453 isoform X2 [Ipomoea nil]XP_019177156.1 PREDICTED: uncharacterized protein LOC109172453 isoform X2 [Ipomoea nil]
MKSSASEMSKAQRSKSFQREGPNWVLIAGSALISTLSIRLGYKLKQVLDEKEQNSADDALKGNENPTEQKKSRNCYLQSGSNCLVQDDENCYSCLSGTRPMVRQHCNDPVLRDPKMTLPLVMVPAPEFSKENGEAWLSSTDRLDLPQKPLHNSNSCESLCVSEAGSDIFLKREVIQKLRQQLKRRDETILAMQEQIVELQSSLNAQLCHSTHLQSLLDVANREVFESERETQRLRKAITDHCVGQVDSSGNPPTGRIWPVEGRKDFANGHREVEKHLGSSEKERADRKQIEMLKHEVDGLKEAIEGKEYLIRNYKDQKSELSMKIKELQERLDSQLPNIL